MISLHWLITPSHVYERIESSLQQELHLSLQSDGLPSVKLLPRLSITFPRGQLRSLDNPQWQLTYAKTVITMPTLAYWAKTPKLTQVDFSNATLTTDESFSLSNSSVQELLKYPIEHINLLNFNVKNSDWAAQHLTLHLDTLPSSLRQLDFEGELLIHNQRVHTQLKGLLPGVSQMAESVLPIEQLKGEMKGTNWQITIEKGRIPDALNTPEQWQELQGNTQHTRFGEFFWQSQSLLYTFNRLHLHDAQLTPVGATAVNWGLTLSGDIDWKDSSLLVPKLILQTSPDTSWGTAFLSGFAKYDLTNQAFNLSISGLLQDTPASIQLERQGSTVSLVSPIQGHIEVAHFPAVSAKSALKAIDMLWPESAEIGIKIHTLDQPPLNNIEGKLRITHNELSSVAPGLQADILGKPALLTFSIARDGHWQANLETHHTELQALGWPLPLSGLTNLHLIGQGYIGKSSDWKGNFLIQSGQLIGINIPEIARLLKEEIPVNQPPEVFTHHSRTSFPEAQGHLSFTTQEGWKLSQLVIQTSQWNLKANGDLTSEKSQMTGEVDLKLFAKTVPLPFSVSQSKGTPPTWVTQWERATDLLQEEAEQLPWSWDRAKQKGKRWWQNFEQWLSTVIPFDLWMEKLQSFF